ncbi:hypothetical protein ACQKRQ_26645 [Paraburkholderia sp. NPDC080076]
MQTNAALFRKAGRLDVRLSFVIRRWRDAASNVDNGSISGDRVGQ